MLNENNKKELKITKVSQQGTKDKEGVMRRGTEQAKEISSERQRMMIFITEEIDNREQVADQQQDAAQSGDETGRLRERKSDGTRRAEED